MNYIEVEDYYSTLNLAIEIFEKLGLPEYHLTRIHKIGELVEESYSENRDMGEIITEEEFCRGMLLDSSGQLILDDKGCAFPDPSYSVLDEAKKRSTSQDVGGLRIRKLG